MIDENYHLAPLDEDELRLAPIADEEEEEEKRIAPDVPFRRGAKLIPVVCSSCKTRLHAAEHQVGLWKKCPDCFRLTQIPAVEPEYIPIDDDPGTARGYELREPEVGDREVFRIGVDYRTLEDDHGEKRTIPRHFEDDKPKLEQLFNNLLTTKEEKEEERQVRERERKITEEIEAVKRAAREGRLEEHLGRSPGDSLATRLEARRRMADAAKGPSLPTPTSLPLPPPQPPALRLYSEPRPEKSGATSNTSADDADRKDEEEKTRSEFFTPFLAASSRARMIVFLICGLIGNFFGEEARAAAWRVLADLESGHVFGAADQGHFLGSFWVGAVFSVVWLTMMFLFGISIFFETAKGKHRIDRWVPFNLDFGLSYFGWSFLMILISAFPGVLVWMATDLPTAIIVSQFLCFPLLFLCVIESDTFFGTWPRETLVSLKHRTGLWLRFYVDTVLIVGVPSLAVVGLYRWDVTSSLFSVAAAVILTLAGLFPLFYFRRLGLLAATIRQG